MDDNLKDLTEIYESLVQKDLIEFNHIQVHFAAGSTVIGLKKGIQECFFYVISAINGRTNRMGSNMWSLELSNGDIAGLGSAQRCRLFAWTNFEVAGRLQNWTTFPLNGSNLTRREKRY
jgi:hypothetical protein